MLAEGVLITGLLKPAQDGAQIYAGHEALMHGCGKEANSSQDQEIALSENKGLRSRDAREG
jgi:hypothetical protein